MNAKSTQGDASVPHGTRNGLGRGVALGVSGFVGTLIAILGDLSQKNDASSVRLLGQNLHEGFPSLTGEVTPDVTYLVVAFLFMALGTGLCFIFDVKTKQGALYMGGSVIAFIMAFVPYELAQTAATTASVSHSVEPALIGILHDGSPLGLLHVQERRGPLSGQMTLVVEAGRPLREATITLRDKRTAAVVGRSRFVDLADSRHEFHLDINPMSEYALSVEAPGHRNLTCSFRADPSLRIIVRLETASWFRLPGFGNLNLSTSLGDCPTTPLRGGG